MPWIKLIVMYYRQGSQGGRGKPASSAPLHPDTRPQANGARGAGSAGHGLEVA